MRFIGSALALLLAMPALAEAPDPACFAAGDRLARATFAAAIADPVIAERRTRTPTEEDLRAAAAMTAADLDGSMCLIILGLPESSLQSLARSFVEEMKRDLDPHASPTP